MADHTQHELLQSGYAANCPLTQSCINGVRENRFTELLTEHCLVDMGKKPQKSKRSPHKTLIYISRTMVDRNARNEQHAHTNPKQICDRSAAQKSDINRRAKLLLSRLSRE